MPFPTDVLHVVTVPPPMTDAEKAEGVSAPANYKDPAKIAEYIRDNAERAWLRLALDPWQCRVPMVTAWWLDEDGPATYDLRTDGGLLALEARLARIQRTYGRVQVWGGQGLGGPALLAEILRGDRSEAAAGAARLMLTSVDDLMTWLASRGPFGVHVPSLDVLSEILGVPGPLPDLDAARVLASLDSGDGVVQAWSKSRCATLRAVAGRLHEAGVL